MDLHTVLTHELGHVLGYEDLDSEMHGNDLMIGELSSGEQRLF